MRDCRLHWQRCIQAANHTLLPHGRRRCPTAVRTLTGHRSSCLSVAFHPFGDFVASGSLDTNLKVWDLRLKECIQTYKGHA